MPARENILSRLRNGSAPHPVVHRNAAHGAGDLVSHAGNKAITTDQMRQQFIELLRANHAQVMETNDLGLAELVITCMRDLGITRLMGGEEVRSLLGELGEMSLQWQQWPTECNDAEKKETLFSLTPVAITTAAAGIAETGSLVLIPSATEPRSLSLIPPTHLVIIREKDLHPDLESYMALSPWGSSMPTNIVLVSGPSKTADIQQTLAFGAHGPSRLVVFLVL
ncbi:LUD domain-containing protein [Microbulbifer sp. YPW1]|uniref:LutC/YkgG family protein n=1 Tax=Microbulbifer sp. YPW1 TaxID=2745199 RepID=UPI00159859FA|nr:LUD domain-containing protein [Microbulbifer sp. YPW1]QKX17596.1 LUD domain-containing protein [Microbulbifer sp. YPW1]